MIRANNNYCVRSSLTSYRSAAAYKTFLLCKTNIWKYSTILTTRDRSIKNVKAYLGRVLESYEAKTYFKVEN